MSDTIILSTIVRNLNVYLKVVSNVLLAVLIKYMFSHFITSLKQV